MTPDMRADTRAADTEFFRLLATGDAAGLAALLTHDFMLIDVFQGAEIPRSALLELIASGQLRFEPVIPRDVQVRRHGATSIVTGRTDMRGQFDGIPFATASRYNHIYVEEDGAWHLVSAQGTIIAPDSPAAE
jgi:ketosteroid isomerase-like protein